MAQAGFSQVFFALGDKLPGLTASFFVGQKRLNLAINKVGSLQTKMIFQNPPAQAPKTLVATKPLTSKQ